MIDPPSAPAARADIQGEAVQPAADPVGRHDWTRDALGLAFVVVVLVVVHAPVLLSGKTYSTDSYYVTSNGWAGYPGQVTAGFDAQRRDLAASIYAFEPWSRVVSEAYKDGQLPLWTPYQGAGAPLAANGQSAAFDPTMALVLADPSQRTWDLTIFATFVVSGCATYVLVRVVGCRRAGAVTGGVVFALSGYFFLSSNNSFTRTYMYLPLVYLAVEWVLRSRRVPAMGALAAATAGCVLVGMPEAAFLVLGSAAVYAVARIVLLPGDRSRWRSLAWVAAGFGAGTMLAAPFVLPFAQYERLAVTGHTASGGAGGAHEPFSSALTWIAPFFNGHDVYAGFSGGPTSLHNWVGGAALALALVSLASTQVKRVSASAAFLVPAVLMLAKVYGLPVVALIGHVPLVERVNFAEFGTPVAALGIAVAAGFGTDAIARRAVDRRRLLLIGGVTVLAGLVWLATSTSLLSAIGPSKYGGPALVAVATMTAAFAIAWWSTRSWTAWLAVGVVTVEMVMLFPTDNLAVRADPYLPPGWLQAAASDMAAHPYARVFGFDALLMPNISSAFDLADIRTLDAIYPKRYFRYIKTFVEPQIKSRFEGTTATVNDETTPINYADNPMFDLLGVRYLFSRAERSAPGLSTLVATDGVNVYANAMAAPRAFVVHDVTTVADEDAAVATMSAGGQRFADGAVKVSTFDPRSSAVVEADAGAVPVEACDGRGDHAEITGYRLDSVTLRVTAACPGLLVLTDTYFPGWQATVDGRGAPVVATDLALRGVPVPAGTSTVVFRFRPAPLRLGVLLASLAAIGIIVLGVLHRWLWPRWQGRRAGRAVES